MRNTYKSNRKKRHTTRRMIAGAPDYDSADSKTLRQLFNKYNWNNRSNLDKSDIDTILGLSPYACSYNNYYLLESFVTGFIKQDTNENRLINMVHNTVNHQDILINIINKTVEQQDPILLSNNIVVSVINKLLVYKEQYNRSMVLLLKSIPPIHDVRTINRLYQSVINALNPTVLEALVDAGHVPLTKDHYDDIKQMYHNSNIYHFNAVFNKIRPSAQTHTTNFLYSLNQHNARQREKNPLHNNLDLTSDNVDELYSHLVASAKDANS